MGNGYYWHCYYNGAYWVPYRSTQAAPGEP